MTTEERRGTPNPLVYYALAGFIMAYGWGYRGTVGHEAGAMVPGALLGLALCLGSGRLDWHRRAAVAGLFAAIGWAWGGSLSYMEQTFYTLSDSRLDVLYGYTMLFFLGGLWAGVGGGILGLALTEPRSELERLIRPFTAICAVFFAVYLYFFCMPEHAEANETFTVRHFHDGDWLSATITLVVSAAYWLLRPKDRPAAALFFWSALAWWFGYLGFTKFGGLRLGPLHRSESWGGLVGVLLVLMFYLIRRRNRAALMLSLYGILGGGMAFAFAVFIRHPLIVQWGPFQGSWPQWRVAEDSFGFFMGLAIALGAHRLIRGGLTPPQEDTPRPPLDVYAVFVMLIALNWINFRRHAKPWLTPSNASDAAPFLGISGWGWYVIIGALVTAPLLCILNHYRHGDRQVAPRSAFGKGAVVTLLLIWVTVAGFTLRETPSPAHMMRQLLLWVPAAVASCVLLSYTQAAQHATVPVEASVAPSDPKWRVGIRYGLLWMVLPVFLLGLTHLSMAMQEEPLDGIGRKRFGPDAYWRKTARLQGAWRVVGMAQGLGDAELRPSELAFTHLAFDPYRNVTATSPAGDTVDAHRWFLKNQYTWLDWHAKDAKHPERAEVPLQFRGQRLFIAWPPDKQDEGYLVFERVQQ